MKIKGIWMPLCVGAVLAQALAPAMAFAGDNSHSAVRANRLTGKIDYALVPIPRPTDDEGRMLVWEGTIHGDIEGTMKWWFDQPSPAPVVSFLEGKVAYYAARWEIWDAWGDTLLLAGESAGKTVFPPLPDETGIWDGHGVVTEAHRGLNPLKGRHIYETGPVITPADHGPKSGTGLFVIY